LARRAPAAHLIGRSMTLRQEPTMSRMPHLPTPYARFFARMTELLAVIDQGVTWWGAHRAWPATEQARIPEAAQRRSDALASRSARNSDAGRHCGQARLLASARPTV
jgi:hypothetical protein